MTGGFHAESEDFRLVSTVIHLLASYMATNLSVSFSMCSCVGVIRIEE